MSYNSLLLYTYLQSSVIILGVIHHVTQQVAYVRQSNGMSCILLVGLMSNCITQRGQIPPKYSVHMSMADVKLHHAKGTNPTKIVYTWAWLMSNCITQRGQIPPKYSVHMSIAKRTHRCAQHKRKKGQYPGCLTKLCREDSCYDIPFVPSFSAGQNCKYSEPWVQCWWGFNSAK